MKRLDRYLLRELLPPLFLGTVMIAMLFMANDLIFVFKMFNVQQVPGEAVAQLILFKLPYWLTYTLPVGAALGASLAMSRLARESELTALRSAGISIRRVIAGILIMGALMSVANFFVVERLVPRASLAYRELIAKVSAVSAVPEFQSNVMIRLDRYVLQAATVIRERDGRVRLVDVLVVEQPEPGRKLVYVSPRGFYDKGVWTFEKPRMLEVRARGVGFLSSDRPLTINEPIRVNDLFMSPVAEEMTAEELEAAIRAGRQTGANTRSLEVNYHTKFSLPASCLVFALAGSLMAVRLTRMGPFAGVLGAFGLLILYYNGFVISRDIVGMNGWLPPVWAAWLPNLLFLGLSAWLGRRIE